MKPHWMLLLIGSLLATCRGDEPFGPQDYDGDYPYVKGTRAPIPTYEPEFTSYWRVPPITTTATPVPAGGQYSLMFKGHDWNHWPYINVSFRKGSSRSTGFEFMGDQILGVSFAAQSDFDCSMETVGFTIPSRVSRYRFGQEVSYGNVNPSFRTYDCDEIKDRIVPDSTAENWVNIIRLDSLTKQVEGSFDLSFRITRKDTTYSIIYPTRIRMRGNFNGPYTTR